MCHIGVNPWQSHLEILKTFEARKIYDIHGLFGDECTLINAMRKQTDEIVLSLQETLS